MDRPRCVAVAAVAVCLLRMVERSPAFAPAPGAAGRAQARPGVGAAGQRAAASAEASGSGPSLGGFAVATLALGALGVSARKAARQRAGARVCTQVRADASGLVGGGPVVVYTEALMDAANKKQEQVTVAQDMMMLKAKFLDEDFLDELQFVVNETSFKELDRAKGLIKLLEPFGSTVVPKFILFLAKKKRLMSLKVIAQEFVSKLYDSQGIAPVKVSCAQRLTDEQMEGIKEKMKEKTGANDIKLIVEVDASLLGGFTVEWGYPDPEDLSTPTDGIDLSLKAILAKAALNQGVLSAA